jgi:60 kDa SS-A/Ro ribonucleoprotein
MSRPELAGVTSKLTPADSSNEAGGPSYRLSPRHALAQLAATGCLAGMYYAQAEEQLEALRDLAGQVDDNLFLAKLAVYSRERAFLKDLPVALLLILSRRDPALFRRAFGRVVDNGRTLRTLFRMIRAGQLGRRSLSYALQRAFQRWLNEANVGQLLSASIGSDPSLRDVFRLARPTPPDNVRRALFGWLTDRPETVWAPATTDDLPIEVRDLQAYRRAESEDEQAAVLERNRFRWDLLADAAKGPKVWKTIARQMGPQALRMNLNTLQRHGVFDDPALVSEVAARLSDPVEIRRSRQFPYQYLAAYLNAGTELPEPIRKALNSAAEIACGNVPVLPGPVVIGLDVSGSMSSAVTGNRAPGSVSKMRCVDVAALFAAALLRRNPGSVVIPFDTQAHAVTVEPNEPILALAARLARYGGGGTDCSIPLREANKDVKQPFAGCILVSDMESWVGTGRHGSTPTLTEWQRFSVSQLKHQGTHPRLVCINLQPHGTVQAPERSDILNVGGFSDAVFDVVAAFLGSDADRFVTEVEAVEV